MGLDNLHAVTVFGTSPNRHLGWKVGAMFGRRPARINPQPQYMLTTGTQVQIHFPGAPAACGQLVGHYSNEPRRMLVRLVSGESLVVMETDVEPVNNWQTRN